MLYVYGCEIVFATDVAARYSSVACQFWKAKKHEWEKRATDCTTGRTYSIGMSHIQRAVTFSVPHVVVFIISHRLYDGVLRSLCSITLLLYHFSHLQWCHAQASWLVRDWLRIMLFDGLSMTFKCRCYSLEAEGHRICACNRPGQYSQIHFILQKHTVITLSRTLWGAISHDSKSS